ncbi:uncharacterized protein BDR25DRAFT_357497 [Lindgomyces ingoldianus]|uniref:Uncharacterized protein n=1 Tax=Lindgomyces ingoldianus TaxID=673940 RepID=A0ACB6QNK2_9PLEO|nr:uncharacterized protein BDR25DRAFT_357497 [Lindgomyces ingoldianus]KAF2468564.1 hypothetical protein BDR25DRAFT_357497 [Lindgomyces ingoldianus]
MIIDKCIKTPFKLRPPTRAVHHKERCAETLGAINAKEIATLDFNTVINYSDFAFSKRPRKRRAHNPGPPREPERRPWRSRRCPWHRYLQTVSSYPIDIISQAVSSFVTYDVQGRVQSALNIAPQTFYQLPYGQSLMKTSLCLNDLRSLRLQIFELVCTAVYVPQMLDHCARTHFIPNRSLKLIMSQINVLDVQNYKRVGEMVFRHSLFSGKAVYFVSLITGAGRYRVLAVDLSHSPQRRNTALRPKQAVIAFPTLTPPTLIALLTITVRRFNNVKNSSAFCAILALNLTVDSDMIIIELIEHGFDFTINKNNTSIPDMSCQRIRTNGAPLTYHSLPSTRRKSTRLVMKTKMRGQNVRLASLSGWLAGITHTPGHEPKRNPFFLRQSTTKWEPSISALNRVKESSHTHSPLHEESFTHELWQEITEEPYREYKQTDQEREARIKDNYKYREILVNEHTRTHRHHSRIARLQMAIAGLR